MNQTCDLTRGPVMKGMAFFALPCILTNVLQNLYNLADAVVVGQMIDTTTLAAVGAAGSLVALFTNSISGLMSGFAVVAGNRYGAKDEAGLSKVIANTLLLSVMVSAVLSVLGAVCSGGMLRLLQTPVELMPQATRYLMVIYAGVFDHGVLQFLL